MSVKVARDRFIVSSLHRCVGLYQQLFKNASSFEELGNKLVKTIETAQTFRQAEKVEELASFLSNFPLKEYRLIGQYYRGLWLYRKGENSRDIFEKIAENSSTYRAKAFWSLAAIESANGNFEQELKYLLASLKFAHDPRMLIELSKGIAVIKAKEGYHTHALKDLEGLLPILRFAEPHIYFDTLNSLAVEFLELGRIQEARNISNIVLASPYAFAYPEWRETGDDITLRGYKSRSSVLVIQSFSEPEKVQTEKIQNLLKLPERIAAPVSSESNQPAKLFNYLDWKKKMGKDNGEETNIDNMSDKDIFMEIMHLSSQETITRKQLQQILDAVKKITSKKN